MNRLWRGFFSIALSGAAALAGCAGPMGLREAQTRAQDRMTRYCAGRCSGLRLVHSQRIKDRWMIDFDSPARKYTVVIDDGGNSRLSVWDKSRDASGQ